MSAHLHSVAAGAAQGPDSGWTAGELVAQLPPGATVADVGCFGWLIARQAAGRGLRHIGVDRSEPPHRPAGAGFATMAGHRLHLPDDVADFVVAAHVIEHLHAPVEFVAELARITRPGGRVFIEAPSELSALPVSSDDAQDHSFASFWDDPTHVRPYTPGALYRLAISAGMVPEFVGRGMAGSIPVATLLARVPFSGSVEPRYCSFKEVPAGLVNAMQAVWPERSATHAEEERLAAAIRSGMVRDGG